MRQCRVMLVLTATLLQSCTGARSSQSSPCVVLAGACVSASIADAACGPSRRAATDGRCVAREACGRGLARDLESGICSSSATAREAARNSGIRVAEDEIATCTAENELVMAEGRLACFPRVEEGARCPREQVGVPPVCTKVREGGWLDLGLWMRSVLEGLCPAVQGSALGIRPETIDVGVIVRVPGNDLSLSSIEVQEGNAAWMRLLTPYVEALRALGGQASTAVAEGRLRCPSRTLLPRPEPAEVVGDP